jgi:nucleoside 2-deoxyribosyltransferase
MPERDPIDLIRDQLNRAGEMAGFHADHENFKHWHSEIKTILEKVFGSKSVHYQNFLALRFREMSVKAFASAEIDKINAARYKKDVENVKNILQSAIKELTLDRTLFKKIQTTPKTVEVTLKGEYFISSGIEESDLIEAIKKAFEGSGLTPVPSTEVPQKEKSLSQRIDLIKRAKLGIYDLSNPGRPDTLLELGVALGLGKEAVIICRKGSALPEGLKALNRIEYENLSDLTEKLRKKAHHG